LLFDLATASAVSIEWTINGTAYEVYEANDTVAASNPDTYVYLHRSQTSVFGYHLSGTDVCLSPDFNYKGVWSGSGMYWTPGTGKVYKGCVENGLDQEVTLKAVYGAHSDGYDYSCKSNADNNFNCCDIRLQNTRHARPVMLVKCWGAEEKEKKTGKYVNTADIFSYINLGGFTIPFTPTHPNGRIDSFSYLFTVTDNSNQVITYFADTGTNTTRNPNAEVIACKADPTNPTECIPPRTDKVCSSESQIILKLSQESNAYGSIVDDNNYGWRICYDEIFGEEGSGVRQCSNANDIVWLHENYNAYASASWSTDYPIPVCYGDLVCTIRQNTCTDDEKMVVALYQESNTNLTDANYLPSGAVGYWKLDGNTKDSIGASEWEVNGGGIEYFVGKIGKAGNFDGVNDYLDASLVLNTSQTSISAEVWVRPNSVNGAAWILEQDAEPAKGRDWIIIDSSLSVVTHIGGGTGETNPVLLSTSPNETSLNQWNHIVVTYQLSSDNSYATRKIYINGLSKAEDSIANVESSSSGLRIGVDRYLKQTYFDGRLDEIVVYNKALTSEEIQHRYNVGLYEKKVCCANNPGQEPGWGTYWTDITGTKIVGAIVSYPVKLIASIQGISSEQLNYIIKKKESLFNIDWLWPDSRVDELNGYGYALWYAGKNSAGNYSAGDFYFIAKTPEGIEYNSKDEEYGLLQVEEALCVDEDRDGFGEWGTVTVLCNNTEPDCNDNNKQVNSEMSEKCDNDIDDNCDGKVNENCPPCREGTTLCVDGLCKEDCGGNIVCTINDNCELGEGCDCPDCTGETDSCETNLTCATSGVCEDECNNGYCDVNYDCTQCQEYGDCTQDICTNIPTCKSDNDCSADINCSDAETLKIDYFCAADGYCNFYDYSENCPTKGNCTEGKSLCPDGYCKDNCVSACDEDSICDKDEGCSCEDCWGEEDSCAEGLNCSSITKNCVDICDDNVCSKADCNCELTGSMRGDCSSIFCLNPPICGICPANETCDRRVEKTEWICQDGFCASIKTSCNTQQTCEEVIPGEQGLCDKNGERGCWDPYALGTNKCCGDETENWYDLNNNVCCLGVFYLSTSSPNTNPCLCTLMSGNTLFTKNNTCDTHNETYCWDLAKGQCCGDISNETWLYSSNTEVNAVLPLESCINGQWYIRNESDTPTLYNLWVE
jgi:hypothetical protein